MQRAAIGQASLLDLGFTTKEHRLQWIRFFKEQGIEVHTHFLDVPVPVRKSRVEKRNSSKGDTFVMTVDDSLFEYMESIFEPPSENEGAKLILIQQ